VNAWLSVCAGATASGSSAAAAAATAAAAESLFNLAARHERGLGTRKDVRAALALHRAAAATGHAGAQYAE
jgi:TPR repeat protein